MAHRWLAAVSLSCALSSALPQDLSKSRFKVIGLNNPSVMIVLLAIWPMMALWLPQRAGN